MTALRQSAIMELEKIPEDKLSYVIQIMQGVNGLYNDTNPFLQILSFNFFPLSFSFKSLFLKVPQAIQRNI